MQWFNKMFYDGHNYPFKKYVVLIAWRKSATLFWLEHRSRNKIIAGLKQKI